MKMKNLLCAAVAISTFVFPAIANAEVEKAYTLTPVENATDTSITLYEYDKDTQTIKETYNELTLNKTNYGSGDTSENIEVSIPNNKTQTITVNYDSSNLSEKIKITGSQMVNSNFINNSSIVTTSFSSASGGAIYNNGSIKSIVGDFINNSASSSVAYSNSYGGAIYNSYSLSIGNITGDFIKNSVTNTFSYQDSYAYGGAIYNVGIIGDVKGDFVNNSTESYVLATYENSYAHSEALGGAIYNGSSGVMGNIIGSFVNNSATAYVPSSYATPQASGGAIYNSYSSTIGDITGDFINNSVLTTTELNSNANAHGGAIYNQSTIGDITGNFINNSATSSSNAFAGAISNFAVIGNITGDFINNSSLALNGHSQGGAILNGGTIESITGNFIDNSAIGSSSVFGGAICQSGTINYIIGDFVNNSVAATIIHSNASGGAIYNSGITEIITGNFINNSATVLILSSNAYARGGAIYLGNKINSIVGDFINNSVIASNAQGGAIYNDGNLEIINNNFIKNTASGSFSQGGAIFNNCDIETIMGVFSKNSASGENAQGGAIYNYELIGTIASDFIENSAIGSYSQGGAIYNESTITNINSFFANNSAVSSKNAMGGAIYNIGTIENLQADFVQNIAQSENENAFGGAFVNSSFLPLMSMTLKIDDTPLGTYILLEEEPSNLKTILSNINALENKSISENGVANGGFASILNSKFVIPMELQEITSSQEEHDEFVYEYQQMIDEMFAEGYLYNLNDISFKSSIELNNSNIYKNEAIGKTGANGGAIYIGTKNVNANYFMESKEFYYGDEYLGKYWYDMRDSYGTEEKIKIGTYNLLEVKDSIFEENIVKTVDGFANGGAIAIMDDMSIDNLLQNAIVEKEDLKNYWRNFSSKEEALQYIKDENEWISYEEAKEQYEVDKAISNINIENTSFFNNIASSENGTALGGAISSETDLTITADGKDVTFAGNKTISAGVEDDNAIYLDKNAVVTFDIKNNAQVNMIDNINGTDGFGITITGDSTGTFNLLNTIGKANLSLGNANINMLNDQVNTYELNTLTAVGNSNLYVDVDLANKTMDRFTTTGTEVVHNGVINVAGMNLLSDAKTNLTKIEFADSTFKDNVTVNFGQVGKDIDNKFQTIAYTPIYAYDVTYDASGSTGNFVFKGGPSTQSFSPAVLSNPVAQSGAQSIQMDSFSEAFKNMDTFMLMPENERLAYKYRNKYASLSSNLIYDPTMSTYQNNTGWFRPYTTFENIPLKNGPKVSNVTYGSFFGYDSALHELGKGWDGTLGVYAGYTGSHQSFNGNSVYQNGGTLGVLGVAYKGNFFTGLTANIGATAGSTSNIQGEDNFTALMGGISSKTGYNFEFADGKVILQPSMIMSYSLVDTFDYTNAAGVRMSTKPNHTLQLEPGLKVIGNIGTWQPYANVSMIWTVLNEQNIYADNVKLPKYEVKPYVKYGVGLQKRWKDKFTAFGQAYVTNGGRNGVGLQAGLRIAIGDETTKSKAAWLNPRKMDTIIVLDGKVK